MVLMGMSTDEWDARVRETGPVAAHRSFTNPLNVAGVIADIKADHARGVTPYWSVKFNSSWSAAASGADDAVLRQLGAELAKLPYRTYGSFHHEPRGDSVSTPQQLVPWASATVRAIGIVKALAGPQHRLGTTDNGFPWSAKWGKLTDAQLTVYYTPALLAAVDFLGADFYDGRTDSNAGEPASVKMANFAAWAQRVAPSKPLAAGEWNAVTAADIRAGWAVLKSGRWAIACLFNSSNNNRPDLPTDGSLGNPPTWVLKGDRLAAFRAVLAEANVEPDPEPDPQPPVDPPPLDPPVDPRDAQIVALMRERDLLKEDVAALRGRVAELDMMVVAASEQAAAAESVVADYDHRLDTIEGIAARTASPEE